MSQFYRIMGLGTGAIFGYYVDEISQLCIQVGAQKKHQDPTFLLAGPTREGFLTSSFAGASDMTPKLL